MVPCIDEFGGYSSRLRIPELEGAGSKPRSVRAKPQAVTMDNSLDASLNGDSKGKRAENEEDLDMGRQSSSLNYNLCSLLGIDVEEIALQIVIKDQTNRKAATLR